MFWPSGIALRIAGAGAVLAIVLGAGWGLLHQLDRIRDQADQAGYARAQAEYQALALQAAEQARRSEQQAAARAAIIERQAHDRQVAHDRAAAGARDELERLRNALAAVPAGARGAPADGAAAAGQQHGPAAAADVAAQCAGRLLEVARAADAMTGHLITLQDWVRAVPEACVASMAD